MKKKIFIKVIVKKNNIAVEKDFSISDAINQMYKNKEGTIVVLDKNEVVGILTEKDLVQLLNSKTNLDQDVINIAYKNIISINENRRLEYALNVLIDNHIRRLVIVDNDNRFVGLVTQEMIISNFETEYYRENLKVMQIVTSLTKNIITIDIGSVLEDAVETMFNNDIGSVLISQNSKIVGIVTERDLVYLATKKMGPSTPVKEIMHSPVISVGLNDYIEEIIEMMRTKNIRRVLVKDLSGNDLCVMGTRDIVKNLKGTFGLFMETKLKYTKEALNNINEIIFELYKNPDSDLLIQWVNKNTLNRYGNNIIDKPISTLVKEEKLDLLLNELNKHSQVIDYNLDIGEYSYRVSINNSHSSDTILLVCKDITRIKELENEVKEQQIIFENIFEKSSDGILLIEDNKIIDCNESILKILEKSNKSEIVELNPSQLFFKDNLNELMSSILKDGYYTFECVRSKANGEELWLDVVGTKIVQNSKDIIHAVFRDISEKKRVEYELEELNKSLILRVEKEVNKNREKDKLMLQQNRLAQMGEIISMIAHQWRQPLNNLSILIQTISIKYLTGKLNDELVESFNVNSNKHIQNMSKTIDNFRDFFKPEKEKIEFCLKDSIREALGIGKSMFENNEIKIVFNNNDEEFLTNGYPNELSQSILNILNNAKDAFIDNDIDSRKIEITIHRDNDTIVMLIIDNAGGIPSDIIDKIFDPYFSTKEEKNGTGLGLYMSKIIIQEHFAGKLSASNEKDGAVFKIELGGI